MSGALRQIFALFDVDTGEATTKLKALNTQVTSVKDVLGALGGSILGAFSVHAISDFLGEAIELGSVLNDTAEKLGVGTDELQKFQFAAGLSGVGAEEAGRALGFLSKNMGEAIGGSKEQAQMFSTLGIEMKDAHGNVRELGDVIPEVADAFAKMGSSQEQTAAAMKLFGKSGAALIPLLKGGGEELAKMNTQFEDLGLGIDEDFIQKADDAGDRIDTMKLGFRSLKTRVAAELLPSISDLATRFSQWIANGIKVTRETHIVKEAWWGLGLTAGIVAGKTAYSWSKVLGLFPKGGNLVGNLFKMGELGLILGALLLVGGAIEDIVVMCQGGESVIGDFLDEMLGAEEKQKLVESLTQAWRDMQPAINDLKPLIAELGGIFAKVLPYMIALVVDLVKAFMTVLIHAKGIGTWIADLINGAPGAADKTAAKAGKETADLWRGGSTLMNLVNAPAPTVTAATAGVPFGPPAPPNMNIENHFEINGAGDPSAVGQRVASFQRTSAEDAARAAANALATGTE